MVRTVAEARRVAAINENVRWLAHSDHRPIRVTAATAAATGAASAATAAATAGAVALRVSSWNVQEHVRDGLSIYVALLPGVAGARGSGAGPRLVAAMMTPAVLARQRDDVLAFISAELRSGSDAVCLQEVTVALLAELRAAAAPRLWAVHCCGAEAAAAALPEGACAALTVVVTALARRARPAPDVTVEVQQKMDTIINTVNDLRE